MITSRREFLIGGLQVSAAIPFVSSAGRALCEASDGRVLVVVQLTGGNDGLNTVVPYRQDAYFRARPTIGLKPSALHALDDGHAFHPELGGLAELFAEGRLAVHHGVGTPVPNRSHFRSMEIWHTADPDGPPGATGWLGRLADQLLAREPGTLPALHVGGGQPPLALRGRQLIAPTVNDPDDLKLAPESKGLGAARAALLQGEPGDSEDHGELAFLRDAARSTYAAAARMEEISARPSSVDYPDHPLGQQLRLIARLISGGFGTSLFHVELGGFDTHARQAPLHAALMQRLSSALAAFQADLSASGVADRVATFVFSEFGRRAGENGSGGTDHGAGSPVLLLGQRVRGGLHGTPPDLSRLVEGDVPATTDFRAIYAALERDWMGLEPSVRQAPADLFG